MTDHDPVNHPSHYTSHPSGVECLEVTRLLPFTLGNAVKYVWRTELKNGAEDLDKARFYLRDWLAHQGPYHLIRREAALLLERVEAAEVVLHGHAHARPCFFYFIRTGHVDRALSELEALV